MKEKMFGRHASFLSVSINGNLFKNQIQVSRFRRVKRGKIHKIRLACSRRLTVI